jgi:demethylmenaquinone methyltransferase/2-methoxy-6-polyprenyl-1,4-benzoquinol methylase
MRKGIQKVFSEVAETYELVNHVLTFGMDIIWRRKAAREAARSGGNHWLDVCSGTGEMARSLSLRADENTDVFAVDFSYPMMARAMKKNHAKKIHPSLADVSHLPFPDNSFDIVTLSFATRNLNVNRDILHSYLKELFRILKSGGRLINLETSQPHNRIIRALFHLYIQMAVKPVGYLISGSKAGYTYLSHTIPRFYPPEEFKTLLRQAGFSRVRFRLLFLGIAAIHTAEK